MKIETTHQGGELTVSLAGRLDTTTAPALEQVVKSQLDGVVLLVLDLEELSYISSAGLRVLLSAQKLMTKQGKLVLRHVKDTVREVFDVTGFSDILTIE